MENFGGGQGTGIHFEALYFHQSSQKHYGWEIGSHPQIVCIGEECVVQRGGMMKLMCGENEKAKLVVGQFFGSGYEVVV